MDLCDIVLPSDLHFAVSRDVLQSGCHLLLEKPMALAVEHCQELIHSPNLRIACWRSVHEPSVFIALGQGQGIDRRGENRRAGWYAAHRLWRNPIARRRRWRYDINRVGTGF